MRPASETVVPSSLLRDATSLMACDFDKAIEWQAKANKLYTDAEDRKKGDERIKLYNDKKPYRETE